MRNITCIFSDDFRNEINGKYSLIGICSGELYINKKVNVLPQLCVTVISKSSLDIPMASFSIEVKLNGNTLKVNAVPSEILEQTVARAKNAENGDGTVTGVASCTMNLIPVQQDSNVMEVLVSINGDMVSTSKLNIIKA